MDFEAQIRQLAAEEAGRVIQPLVQEIAILREFLPGEMKHKAAAEYLTISEQILRRERGKPGTLIRYRMEGTTPIYNVASLIEYKKSKYLPVLKAA